MNSEEPLGGVDHTAAVIAWLCLPETEALNGRTLYIAGGHLALCAEPELIRSRYVADGWTLDALLDRPVPITSLTVRKTTFRPGKAGRR